MGVFGLLSILSLAVNLSSGEVLMSNQDLDFGESTTLKCAKGNDSGSGLVTTKTPTARDNELSDLLHVILLAIGKCHLDTHLWSETCTEDIAPILQDLPLEKRKVLLEILGMVFNRKRPLVHESKSNYFMNSHGGKKLDVYGIPLQESNKVQELLRHILQTNSSDADVSELLHLQTLIYSKEKQNLANDPIVQKTVNKLLKDIKIHKRKYHYFD